MFHFDVKMEKYTYHVYNRSVMLNQNIFDIDSNWWVLVIISWSLIKDSTTLLQLILVHLQSMPVSGWCVREHLFGYQLVEVILWVFWCKSTQIIITLVYYNIQISITAKAYSTSEHCNVYFAYFTNLLHIYNDYNED